MSKSVTVKFMPGGFVAQGSPGDSILDIAIAGGVPLMHACGGFCACTTCHVKVEAGAENLGEAEEEEIDRIETSEGYDPKDSRLGCQSKVLRGEVSVRMLNVDE